MGRQDILIDQTSNAALRILKGRMRQYIYEELAKVNPDRWEPLRNVNESFCLSAEQEWREVLPLWGDLRQPICRHELTLIIRAVMDDARESTLEICDGGDIVEFDRLISEFERQFSIDSLLPRDGIRLARIATN